MSSLFSPEEMLINQVIKEVEGDFGPVDWISEKLLFDRTRYYEREMGWPLHRRFISFLKLISPDSISKVKLITNKLENRYLSGKKRRINIDPGYISPERLVLATCKNYIHRIYLKDGIYADLTLVFHDGTFKPLPWTYPDYADERVIGFFNKVRSDYLQQLKERGGGDHEIRP